MMIIYLILQQGEVKSTLLSLNLFIVLRTTAVLFS